MESVVGFPGAGFGLSMLFLLYLTGAAAVLLLAGLMLPKDEV